MWRAHLVILDAGDVLNDALAVRRPGIDAESEVRSRLHIKDGPTLRTSR
jgi:hypothetical protein